jgi:hypothetical protein
LTASLSLENSTSFQKTSQQWAVVFNSNKSFIKGKKVTKKDKKTFCLSVIFYKNLADRKSGYLCRKKLAREKSVYSNLEKAEGAEDRVYEKKIASHAVLNCKDLKYDNLSASSDAIGRDSLFSEVSCEVKKMGSPVGAGRKEGAVGGCLRMPDRIVYSEYSRNSRLSDIACRSKLKSEPRGLNTRKIVTSLLSRVRTAICCLCISMKLIYRCYCHRYCCYVLSIKVKYSVLIRSVNKLEMSNNFRTISQIIDQVGKSVPGMSERAGSRGNTVSCVFSSHYNGG